MDIIAIAGTEMREKERLTAARASLPTHGPYLNEEPGANGLRTTLWRWIKEQLPAQYTAKPTAEPSSNAIRVVEHLLLADQGPKQVLMQIIVAGSYSPVLRRSPSRGPRKDFGWHLSLSFYNHSHSI